MGAMGHMPVLGQNKAPELWVQTVLGLASEASLPQQMPFKVGQASWMNEQGALLRQETLEREGRGYGLQC